MSPVTLALFAFGAKPWNGEAITYSAAVQWYQYLRLSMNAKAALVTAIVLRYGDNMTVEGRIRLGVTWPANSLVQCVLHACWE